MLAATILVVYYHLHEFFIIWGIILKLKDSETHLSQPTESVGTSVGLKHKARPPPLLLTDKKK